MFLCLNCGNNIKSLNKQVKTSTINFKMTGCPRWKYMYVVNNIKKLYLFIYLEYFTLYYTFFTKK